MVSSQKVLVLFSLLILSLSIHIIFCEWSTPENYDGDTIRPIDYRPAEPLFGNRHDDGDEVMLYADKLIYKMNIISIIVGIFLPIALSGYAIYLYLGWKLEIDNFVKKIIKSMTNDKNGDGV
jgi:predicted mannosyl-3-phosphoglycerate phosphatase (HAD superfamily)